jgi:hypothetical protein
VYHICPHGQYGAQRRETGQVWEWTKVVKVACPHRLEWDRRTVAEPVHGRVTQQKGLLDDRGQARYSILMGMALVRGAVPWEADNGLVVCQTARRRAA